MLCGICGQRVRASKYQSHWTRCFLRKEKNKAKVKGRNNQSTFETQKKPEIGRGEREVNFNFSPENLDTLIHTFRLETKLPYFGFNEENTDRILADDIAVEERAGNRLLLKFALTGKATVEGVDIGVKLIDD